MTADAPQQAAADIFDNADFIEAIRAVTEAHKATPVEPGDMVQSAFTAAADALWAAHCVAHPDAAGPAFDAAYANILTGLLAQRRAAAKGETGENAKPALDRLIETYALIRIGRKAAVLNSASRSAAKLYDVMDLEAFKALHQHLTHTEWKKDDAGNDHPVLVPAVNAFMRDPKTRRFHGFTYETGPKVVLNESGDEVWNLYRGLADPAPEGQGAPAHWKRTFNFLRDVICAGSGPNFGWLMNWLSWKVKNPCSVPGTVVVLISDQGSGKNTFGSILKAIFGVHYIEVTDSRHIIGNFNSTLVARSIVFCNEAFFAGDKKGMDKLKALVTDDHFMHEAKFQDAVVERNALGIVIATNHRHVVSITADDRRHAFFTVSDHKANDVDYWSDLREAIADEAPHLHRALLDMKTVDRMVRRPPVSTARYQNIRASLDGHEAWWNDVLFYGYDASFGRYDARSGKEATSYVDGFSTGQTTEWSAVQVRACFDAWVEKDSGAKRSSTRLSANVASFLQGPKVGAKKSRDGHGKSDQERARTWIFPALDDARKTWAGFYGDDGADS